MFYSFSTIKNCKTCKCLQFLKVKFWGKNVLIPYQNVSLSPKYILPTHTKSIFCLFWQLLLPTTLLTIQHNNLNYSNLKNFLYFSKIFLHALKIIICSTLFSFNFMLICKNFFLHHWKSSILWNTFLNHSLLNIIANSHWFCTHISIFPHVVSCLSFRLGHSIT